MNADYRAGMLAALATVVGRTTFNDYKPANDYQQGWAAAMRECRYMASALHDAARIWDNETPEKVETPVRGEFADLAEAIAMTVSRRPLPPQPQKEKPNDES